MLTIMDTEAAQWVQDVHREDASLQQNSFITSDCSFYNTICWKLVAWYGMLWAFVSASAKASR